MSEENKKEIPEAEELDQLTGIWNKKAAELRIRECMCGGGTLFLCDVNNMKQVNSRYGHLPGDECLRLTAKTLGFLIREKDILGRTGGDEFAVFMPGCENEETAYAIKQRILDRFAANRRKEEKRYFHLFRLELRLIKKETPARYSFRERGRCWQKSRKNGGRAAGKSLPKKITTKRMSGR